MARMKIDLDQSGLRPASMSDWRLLSDITAEAFADDPVNTWVFGKFNAIRSAFRVMSRAIYLPHGQCYLHGDGGATMWLPPGEEAGFSNWTMAKFALGQLLNGAPGAIARGDRLGSLMRDWHPAEPHMYLFTIGTTKAARGKGIGKALLAPVLKACDEAGMPVYLENSNPDNSGFYSAHGFERMGVFNIGGEASPIMEPMWRKPRG